MKATVVGARYEGTTLFAANHQSWLDILLIGGATGASFVSKDGVRKWPVAGWLATMVGTIYISNKDRAAAAKQAETIGAALQGGKSVAFFPEGKIDSGILLPFRPALFGSVIPPGDRPVAVQPVAIDYGENRADIIWKRGTSAVKNFKAVMNHPGLQHVTIHLLEPIHPGADDHRREIAARCETAVAEALGQEIVREPA